MGGENKVQSIQGKRLAFSPAPSISSRCGEANAAIPPGMYQAHCRAPQYRSVLYGEQADAGSHDPDSSSCSSEHKLG